MLTVSFSNVTIISDLVFFCLTSLPMLVVQNYFLHINVSTAEEWGLRSIKVWDYSLLNFQFLLLTVKLNPKLRHTSPQWWFLEPKSQGSFIFQGEVYFLFSSFILLCFMGLILELLPTVWVITLACSYQTWPFI